MPGADVAGPAAVHLAGGGAWRARHGRVAAGVSGRRPADAVAAALPPGGLLLVGRTGHSGVALVHLLLALQHLGDALAVRHHA